MRCDFKKNSTLYHPAFIQNNPTNLRISIALISAVRRYEVSAVGSTLYHAAFIQNNPTKLQFSIAVISAVRRYEISAGGTVLLVEQ